MNATIQLLQDIQRNAHTGEQAVEQLLGRARGEELRRELEREHNQYALFAQEADALLRRAGGEPEPAGLLAQAGMWAGIEMRTLTDATDSHLAELTLQGATMGIVETTKARNSFDGASEEARTLAGRFVERQQDAVERLKPFLKNAAAVQGR